MNILLKQSERLNLLRIISWFQLTEIPENSPQLHSKHAKAQRKDGPVNAVNLTFANTPEHTSFEARVRFGAQWVKVPTCVDLSFIHEGLCRWDSRGHCPIR